MGVLLFMGRGADSGVVDIIRWRAYVVRTDVPFKAVRHAGPCAESVIWRRGNHLAAIFLRISPDPAAGRRVKPSSANPEDCQCGSWVSIGMRALPIPITLA